MARPRYRRDIALSGGVGLISMSLGTAQVGVSQDRNNSRGLLEVRGSVATMGGGVFLSNWIDDGFAVVTTGAPGLEVLHDNRPVGVTDGRGMLLIPTLRSYQKNKLTIDPSNLPVDAEIENAREVVAPADRSGVLVNFKVRSDTTSALITFVRSDGSFVPAGSVGRLEGGGEFVVGYDGEAFVNDLGATKSGEDQNWRDRAVPQASNSRRHQARKSNFQPYNAETAEPPVLRPWALGVKVRTDGFCLIAARPPPTRRLLRRVRDAKWDFRQQSGSTRAPNLCRVIWSFGHAREA